MAMPECVLRKLDNRCKRMDGTAMEQMMRKAGLSKMKEKNLISLDYKEQQSRVGLNGLVYKMPNHCSYSLFSSP